MEVSDMDFNLPQNKSAYIKVIGVGGGGSNAVNYMASVGVKGVDFIVCNTDAQALENSPVKNKVQLGASITEGLGAGADPEIGAKAAEESLDEIKGILEHQTKMCFVTAGMGGGTGTGAAPIIAKAARDMGILTVGIVTHPFSFEGESRLTQALEGSAAMREAVDSLIIINNDKLREVFGNLGYRTAFGKADEVLASAAKGIAEVITKHYTTNIDLRDAKTVLENSGTALFGTGRGQGPDRAMQAVTEALESPLLNDNHIKGAKNVLLLIRGGKGEHEVTIDEISEISHHLQREAGGRANLITGLGDEEEDTNEVTVTIVATGFPAGQMALPNEKKEVIKHKLEDDVEQVQRPLKESNDEYDEIGQSNPDIPLSSTDNPSVTSTSTQKIVHQLDEDDAQEVEEATPSMDDAPIVDDSPIVDAAPTLDDDEGAPTLSWSIPESESEPNLFSDVNTSTDDWNLRIDEEDDNQPTQNQNLNSGIQSKTFSIDDEEGEGLILEFEDETTQEAPQPVESPFERKISDHPTLAKSYQDQQIQRGVELREGGMDEGEANDPTLNFRVSTKPVEEISEPEEAVNPIDRPLSELKKPPISPLAASRKERMSQYTNGIHTLSTQEGHNTPAFKRAGIEVNLEPRSKEKPSNLGISPDGNLNTNNSFLHDTVD